MNKYYVYAIIDPNSDRPLYIGKGTGNRYKQHLTDKPEYCHNKRLNGRIAKIRKLYGKDPEIKILQDNLEESVAYDMEAELIRTYGRLNYDFHGILLNHLIDCRPPSFSGPDNPFYGKKHTEEAKQKMREAKKDYVPWNKGKAMSEETKAKLRDSAATRIDVNRENVAKMHEANRGKKHSEEWKNKISKSMASKWLITYPDGHQEEITSLNAWGKANDVSHANLIRYGHSKGYRASKIDK
jgi:hypothetical protein